MMKIVVTGGAGFIGSYLVQELAKENEVTIIDNLISGDRRNVPENAGFVEGNVGEVPLPEGTGIVFHFAADPDVKSSAEYPEKSFDSNVAATFRLLEQCRKGGIKSFVFASSSTVYGHRGETVDEKCCSAPISNYGASKAAGEAYASSFSHSYGINVTILRYANIYGEGSRKGVMHDFFFKLRKNPGELEILGDGKQEKTYLHIEDAVAATLLAWKEQTGGTEMYNVGSSKSYTVDQIAENICKKMGLEPKFSHTGGESGWTGDVKRSIMDISKIRALGWEEKISLGEGIDRYLEWLEKEYSRYS